MEYKEEDYLSLSGIQHFEFCRRQWALIHIEQQWQENVRTIEGLFLHQKAHESKSSEKRGDIIISRGMAVFSKTLGVNGFCDVVEFHNHPQGVCIFGRSGTYKPIPIEYKKGEPKEGDADILQLCAQAICLEETLCCHIEEGYLYYGETKHRIQVSFDIDLRSKVTRHFNEMHHMFENKHTPKVKISKSCRACSLSELCMPKLCKNISVKDYISKMLGESEGEKTT